MNTEPSKAARRAAEFINEMVMPDGLTEEETDKAADIIERETGAEEAVRLLQHAFDVIDQLPFYRFHPSDNMPDWLKKASDFLHRFNQD